MKYKLVCHQRKDRSYAIAGKPLLFCARCLGIYVGFPISFALLFVFYGFFNAFSTFLYPIALLVPMAIDALSQLFRKRESNNMLRFVTGYLAGTALSVFFYSAFSIFLRPFFAFNMPSLELIPIFLFMLLALFIIERLKNKNFPLVRKFLNFFMVASLLAILVMTISMWVALFYALS